MFKFTFKNGQKGIRKINNELLDTEERAKQRAIAEFVKASKKETCTFSTYITDIRVGDIVYIEGKSYKIIEKNVSYNIPEIIANYKGVRYVK